MEGWKELAPSFPESGILISKFWKKKLCGGGGEASQSPPLKRLIAENKSSRAIEKELCYQIVKISYLVKS